MRIGIMATGAVGGYFGARLQQAGHEVAFTFAARDLRRCAGRLEDHQPGRRSPLEAQ
jgi:ketopantoate reductase